ncbi:MAG: hypothetical protein HY925_06375 [Elusimicrobia bacterium]|nr:hypothetical protein [Elusimicrobiota bacterium]
MLLALLAAAAAAQTSWPPPQVVREAAEIVRPESGSGAVRITPELVDRIEALFVKAIAEKIEVKLAAAIPPMMGLTEAPSDHIVIYPKLGGNLFVRDGRSVFMELQDPTRPAIRRLAASNCDLAAIERVFREEPDAMERLDAKLTMRLLEYAVKRVPSERARGLPEETIRKNLCLAAATVIANGLEAYTFSSIDDWKTSLVRGRFLGRWYLSPPVKGPAGWLPGALGVTPEGSITVVFQPEGFDLYDATEAAAPNVPVLRYRSAAWAGRFKARF